MRSTLLCLTALNMPRHTHIRRGGVGPVFDILTKFDVPRPPDDVCCVHFSHKSTFFNSPSQFLCWHKYIQILYSTDFIIRIYKPKRIKMRFLAARCGGAYEILRCADEVPVNYGIGKMAPERTFSVYGGGKTLWFTNADVCVCNVYRIIFLLEIHIYAASIFF